METRSHKLLSGTLAKVGLLAAALVAMSAPASAAVTFGPELVVNGGFETVVDDQPTGWTFTAAASDSRAGAEPLGEHSGFNSYFFGSGGDYDKLSQTIATEAFSEYQVQAWVKVDNFFDPDSLSNSLLSGFGPANFFLVQGVHSSPYILLTKTIFAVSNSTELTFFGANKAGNFYVDDVSVRKVIDSVPEPSAWALMIVGFGGVGAMARRSRRIPRTI